MLKVNTRNERNQPAHKIYFLCNQECCWRWAWEKKAHVKGKSSLMRPKCGSMNTEIKDLTLLVPELKCLDCGTEWMPTPGTVGHGLAGGHTRYFESNTSDGETAPMQKQMSAFHAVLLFIIVNAFAILLGMALLLIGLFKLKKKFTSPYSRTWHRTACSVVSWSSEAARPLFRRQDRRLP